MSKFLRRIATPTAALVAGAAGLALAAAVDGVAGRASPTLAGRNKNGSFERKSRR